MEMGQESRKGMGMTEREDRLARERNEIAARIASFKATQDKFKREREEYYVTTLENARNGSDGRPFWS
jgi:chorismate mutase